MIGCYVRQQNCVRYIKRSSLFYKPEALRPWLMLETTSIVNYVKTSYFTYDCFVRKTKVCEVCGNKPYLTNLKALKLFKLQGLVV